MLEISLNSRKLIARLDHYVASLDKITLAKIWADYTPELGEEMDEDYWNCALQ